MNCPLYRTYNQNVDIKLSAHDAFLKLICIHVSFSIPLIINHFSITGWNTPS